MAEQKQPAFGVLNPIQKPFFSRKASVEQFNFSDNIKKVIKDFYVSDTISNTGPYKGIVLRVEGNNADGSKNNGKQDPPPGSWLDIINVPGKKKTAQIRVRVPELHSMLPIPKSSADNAVIDMYPLFIAQDSEIPIPDVNSLVWVDFGNKTNFTDPIYIKPIMYGPGMGETGKSSAVQAFNNCAGVFSSNSPTGDSLAGANKALSHAGLDLMARGRFGETKSKIIKGKRFNQDTVTAWEDGTKKLSFPCTTWIGCLNSNGMNDASHENGKRETIVCAPNMIEFLAPIEIVYYFHDYKEFNDGKDFSGKIPALIERLAKNKRNFVLVAPELPWSAHSKGAKSNLNNNVSWTVNDNFQNFHREVLVVLKESFSDKIEVGYISIDAVGKGGFASVYNATDSGLDSVIPGRIIATEYDPAQLDYVITKLPATRVDLVVKSGTPAASKASNSAANKKILSTGGDNFFEEALSYEEGVELPKMPEPKMPATKNADVSPSVSSGVVRDEIVAAEANKEMRVYLKDYGSLTGNENVLVNVPSVGAQQKLHVLVAKRLALMSDTWVKENPGSAPILVSSGFRIKKWSSEAEYEAEMLKKYKSIEEARKYVAYQSSHEAGLAFDIGNNGLSPVVATIAQQRKTKLYNWMVNNAFKFGITPYSNEPWHWECRLPKESWLNGKEFTQNLAVMVRTVAAIGGLPTMGNGGQNCVKNMSDVSSGGNPNNPNGELGKPLGDEKIKLLWCPLAASAGKPKPDISHLIEKGKKVDEQWGELIKKYQGDVPYALICVRIGHESGGNAKAPPTRCCGETGLLQIWCGKSFAQTKKIEDAVKLGAACRKKMADFDPFDPAKNLWCGLSDWNKRGAQAYKQVGKYFPSPDENFWAYVNIGMNIGDGAALRLLKQANPEPGDALNGLCEWIVKVDSGLEEYKNKGWFGTQSSASVARRILVTSYWVKAAQEMFGKSLETAGYGQPKFLNYA